MSDVATLKSYLVNLGFQVDAPSLGQFQKVLADLSTMVEGRTSNIVLNMAKWTAGVVTLFTAASGAVIAAMDKVAMADQEYRLFGERMFMDTQHAKMLKIALDALKEPLEAIAFDPELHRRFEQLQEDQRKMIKGLGGDFDETMLRMRDMRFEFTRFEVELEYLAQGAVAELFKALGLGSGNIVDTLHSINNYIIEHLPEWSRYIAQYLVPVLKDTWMILKDVAKLVGLLAMGFTNFIAILTGDTSLQTATFNFDKFARAIDKAVNGVAWLIDKIIQLAQFLAPMGGTLAGVVIGGAFGGPAGAAIGGAAGLAYDVMSLMGRGNAAFQAQAGAAGDISAQAKALAQQVSSSTGISPDVLFAQWAHETGGFTNRGAQQLNNLAGIKLPGSDQYRSFGSLQEFGQYYSNLMHSQRYSGALGAQSIDQFASVLKRGGYMADTLDNYERGMRRYMPSGAGATVHIDNSVTLGDIHAPQPNASAEEISSLVMSKLDSRQKFRTSRLLAELTTVYG